MNVTGITGGAMSLYVQTVAKLVDAIVTDTGQPARLTDLMRRTKRPHPTVLRWLHAARDAGYILQDGPRGGWRPAYCPALPSSVVEMATPFELRFVDAVRMHNALTGKRATAPDVAFQIGVPVATAQWYANRLEALGLLKRKTPKTGYMAAHARRRQSAADVLPVLVKTVHTLYRNGGPVRTELLAKELGMARRTLLYWTNKGVAAGHLEWYSIRGGVVPAGRVTAAERDGMRAA